jgi:glycine C-acetyltransferase
MVDEAHATGVIGPTGRGTEEHYGLPGSVDVLMGTFSKAPGTVGGYVCGSRELVYYLRFYAHSAMFTAALPSHLCAGIACAYRVMDEEPEHRERLWANVRAFAPALRAAGFLVSEPESPILTLFVGASPLLWHMSRALFDAGIKVGNVAFPAVPQGEAILRLTVNARHTAEDLEHAVEVLAALGQRYGILHRTAEEIREIGAALPLDGTAEDAGAKTAEGAR